MLVQFVDLHVRVDFREPRVRPEQLEIDFAAAEGMTADVDFLDAVHEAAHSCVGAMYGYDVAFAVLHKRGAAQSGGGRVELHDWQAEMAADTNRFLVFLAAGRAAEKRWAGRASHRDAGDREYAVNVCRAHLNGTEDATAEAVAREMKTADLLAEAAMLDEVLWGWIERVARQLVRRRRLSGRDIAELREAR